MLIKIKNIQDINKHFCKEVEIMKRNQANITMKCSVDIMDSKDEQFEQFENVRRRCEACMQLHAGDNSPWKVDSTAAG